MADPTAQFRVVKPGSFSAATTQKILPCTPGNGVQPTSNAGAFTAATALSGRRLIEVTNEDASVTIRVGDSTIASGSGGRPIFAKSTAQFFVSADAVLYVVSDSVTPLVSWLEYA